MFNPDKCLDLCLHSFVSYKYPTVIYDTLPGISNYGHGGTFINVKCNSNNILITHKTKSFLEKYPNYEWMFSLFSDSTGFSIDILYPSNCNEGELIDVLSFSDIDTIGSVKWVHLDEFKWWNFLVDFLLNTTIADWMGKIVV